MSTKIGTRRSPSGPAQQIQLPYYDTAPTTAATTYATIGAAGSSGTEAGTEYRIPAKGVLGTLLIQNAPVGADAVNVTFRARKNGASVGPALVIPNNASGPVKVDLSDVAVAEGDLVSLQMTAPAFGGAAPISRVFFSWIPAGTA